MVEPARTTIAERLQDIRREIHACERKYNRKPGAVSLLAVSKTRPVADIRAALAAGQRDFGENYLQDALPKIEALHDSRSVWHFIGPIQSNKTRGIAQHFDWVHSVDRLKIARRLSEQRPDHLPALNLCLQINISQESSKAGLGLDDLPDIAAEVAALPRIRLRGLMCIPARAEDLEQQRKPFHRLYEARQSLIDRGLDLDTLSMGMSNDMEAAIAEGATWVRIGTAIFGPRA